MKSIYNAAKKSLGVTCGSSVIVYQHHKKNTENQKAVVEKQFNKLAQKRDLGENKGVTLFIAGSGNKAKNPDKFLDEQGRFVIPGNTWPDNLINGITNSQAEITQEVVYRLQMDGVRINGIETHSQGVRALERLIGVPPDVPVLNYGPSPLADREAINSSFSDVRYILNPQDPINPEVSANSIHDFLAGLGDDNPEGLFHATTNRMINIFQHRSINYMPESSPFYGEN